MILAIAIAIAIGAPGVPALGVEEAVRGGRGENPSLVPPSPVGLPRVLERGSGAREQQVTVPRRG
ncbi:hypothetical protein IOD16_11370 [Saccharothrix sp. 6-C]|uniref:hypothetical protein n=1 Tax=Saccharothrix sp. 6-C TaxID=2781735 RepID=UPI0019176717|nr:hypothetical protein [Saccharothrix sp. 6-C]QQQ78966.1 hypothetical protein IOD16_11370 [Saccharothrix sp. 6-C]